MLGPVDHMFVAEQLGRRPRQVVAVAARCPAGHPSVITCYPLRRKGARVAPFPTLYWLTCPRLCAELAHLERDGAITDVERELASNEAMREVLRQDHDDYIARRWAALSHADQSLVAQLGLNDEFHARGIGGMSNRAAVKCLHLHLAHELVSGNAIGRWIMRRYGLRLCRATSNNTDMTGELS